MGLEPAPSVVVVRHPQGSARVMAEIVPAPRTAFVAALSATLVQDHAMGPLDATRNAQHCWDQLAVHVPANFLLSVAVVKLFEPPLQQ